jgi:hypothetical protein
MQKMGIMRELLKAGINAGDKIVIGEPPQAKIIF